MHRRKDYWGPDGESDPLWWDKSRVLSNSGVALEFDPDRFLDERLNKYFTANPFIFLPFNAGPRICLGQQVRKIYPQCNAVMNFFPCCLVRIQRSLVHAWATSSEVQLV